MPLRLDVGEAFLLHVSSLQPFRRQRRPSRKRELPLAAQKPNPDSVFVIEAPNGKGLWRSQERHAFPSTPPSSPRAPPLPSSPEMPPYHLVRGRCWRQASPAERASSLASRTNSAHERAMRGLKRGTLEQRGSGNGILPPHGAPCQTFGMPRHPSFAPSQPLGPPALIPTLQPPLGSRSWMLLAGEAGTQGLRCRRTPPQQHARTRP